MNAPSASVILPVYDAPKSLTLVLEGYRRQTTRDFELIISDDGSPPIMKTIAQDFARTAPFPVRYLRQEHRGFGKTRAANEAVKVSTGRRLIFSDGDCLPHGNFVRGHLRAARPNSFGIGFITILPLDYCERLTADHVRRGDFEGRLPLSSRVRLRLSHWRDVLTGGWRLRKPPPEHEPGITSFRDFLLGRPRSTVLFGGNFSCDPNTFRAVNGFDENLIDMGCEDFELGWRLARYGAKLIDLWHAAVVFHLDHATDPGRLKHPVRRFELGTAYAERVDLPIRCENGMVKEGQYAGPD